MALKQNGLLSGAPVRFLSGSLATIRSRFGGDGSQFACFAGGFDPTTGIPAGYRPPASFVMPIKDGGISSFTTAGQSTTAAAIQGRGALVASAAGQATTAMNAFLTASRTASAAGLTTTAAVIAAYGRIAASLSIGAQPSATDIAQAVLGGVVIEGNLNLRQLMRAMAAVLLGESTGGNTTFKAANNDAVTRVAGIVDASGNRTSVTLTPGD